jgi:hypothetical protein
METPAMRRVAVWLDSLAPEKGAFAHALEWAGHFGLPLRAAAVLIPVAEGGCAVRPDAAELLAACAAACARKGVAWDDSSCQILPGFEAEQLLRPHELAVVAETLPDALKRNVLGRSAELAVPVLLCPRSWQPAFRVLVVHQQHGKASQYLESAADLCRALGVAPVVLTVARTEGEAREGQQVAEHTFLGRGLAADLDLIVGWDAAAAAAAATRWRRCSHVFLEGRPVSPWQRWLQGDPVTRLRALAATCALLVLPGRRQPVAAGTRAPGSDANP